MLNESLVPTSYSSKTLAIPKLNLQFLTFHDYLLRNFTLLKHETTHAIRNDIVTVLERMSPRIRDNGSTFFSGWSKMGAQLHNFKINVVGIPKLGENKPAFVKADVSFDVSKFNDSVRREWDLLKPKDCLFLLHVSVKENSIGTKNETPIEELNRFGLDLVRGCEICDLVGEDGRIVESFHIFDAESDNRGKKGGMRTYRVLLDTNQYAIDTVSSTELYKEGAFNVIVRRNPQENNFKSILETIRDLLKSSDVVVPNWLHDVFLGYGDPSSAHFSKMDLDVVTRTVDFKDTFLSWDHLVSSFPEKVFYIDSRMSFHSTEKHSILHIF